MNLRPVKFYDESDPGGTPGQAATPVTQPPAPGQGKEPDYKALYEAEAEKAKTAQSGFEKARSERDRLLNENAQLKQGQAQPPAPSPAPTKPSGPIAEIDNDIAEIDTTIEEYRSQNFNTVSLEKSKKALLLQKERLEREKAQNEFMEGLDKFQQSNPDIKDINPIARIAAQKGLSFDDAKIYWNGLTAQAQADEKARQAAQNAQGAAGARTIQGEPLPPSPQAGTETATDKFYKDAGYDLNEYERLVKK